MDESSDLLNQAALAALFDHVWKLGDDDRLFALRERLNVRFGLHTNAATTGLVGIANPLNAKDRASCREVGALDVLHQPVERDVGVVDQRDRRGNHLTKVVRRDVRRHADSDSRGAVHEQVWVARRHHRRLLRAAVVVRYEIDGVHVEIAQHLGRQTRHSRLGVPHRRGWIVIYGAEVALAVDEWVAHREVLRPTYERVVDRGVAVWVEVAHHLADDAGALGVAAGRAEAQLRHPVKDTAMYRLEPIADVRQRTANDHRHRVVEIRGLHLVFERAWLEAITQHICGSHLVVLSGPCGH